MRRVAGLGVLIVFVASACGASADSAGTQTSSERPKITAATSETTTKTPVAAGPKPTCTYSGTDNLMGSMDVELVFTNPLGEVNNLKVTYALLDGEGGTRFFTGTAGGFDLEDVHFPALNEQFRLSVETVEDVPPDVDETTIDCSVLAIEEGIDIGGYQRAADTDTCTVLGVDSSGYVQVEMAVTSPYKETTNVQTWWALQAPGSVRFETETEVVDLVGPGESFRITPTSGAEKPAWLGTDPITCTVGGFWDQGR